MEVPFENTVQNALIWLVDEEGWSELIDDRWTLQVQEILINRGYTEDIVKQTLEVTVYPEPNYNKEFNVYLKDYNIWQ